MGLGIWIAVAVGIVLLLGLALALMSRTGGSSIAGVQTFSGLSRNHVAGQVAYAQNPPVGGDHAATLVNCGIYTQPVPKEPAVHSLEHGAVWITYRPDLVPATVEQLRGLVRGHAYALLSPYEGLPSPIVASAWGLQLQVQDVADPRLAQFLSTYERGPQTPEPGAPCSGGIGVPLGQ
jgi:hypothetical protein